jgi:hypothetical protein
MQRIAYALTDGEGRYSVDTLRIYDENDQIIAVSAPLHEGRGTFVLPSTNGDVYAMVGKERFDLPNALPIGYSMRADMSEDFIDIRVERSSEVAPTAIGLAIFNRENVCYFDTLRMDQNVVEFSLPMCCLHHGINRLELFDVAGRSLACRMVYRTLKDEGLQIYVSQSQSAYASYAPIKLEVQVKDKTNVLENANLSISVRDLNNELIPLLDDLCERYFEETESDWMYYDDWEFGNDNDIYIYYSYESYDSSHETGYTIVDIKTLLEYNDR